MWSRAELKDKAKIVLKTNYWAAFGVSIVLAIAGGDNSWNGNFYNLGNKNSYYFNTFHRYYSYAITGLALLIILRIFIGYSLQVGGTKYFVQSVQYKDNKNCFSYGFSGENYMSIVKTMVSTKILIFLWTLLLIIPGIIKSYAYRMVPYILADNPNIGVKEAITLSNKMTEGHKFDIFVLDLSFIGWYFLGILALGVGTLFVLPYQNTTNAELYLVLRGNALKNNLCTLEDLLL